MIGEMVSHYRILEKLGGGGMGVVYRAIDTRLLRTVALKFLPPERTDDEDAKKIFVQEARSASALDHPNICTLHDIAETPDGQIFLCMAFYDGETLKRKIKRGPLAIGDVIHIGKQIAEGLQKAHSEGIIHRDIKPANIILTAEGCAKIVDFGLAKLTAVGEITQPDLIIGTLVYMSPEQIRGDSIDHRSDLWSFGVVVYEMLTGLTPFRGDDHHTVSDAIINLQPPPVTDFRQDVPPYLLDVLAKTMNKDVSGRYRGADELLTALEKESETGTADSEKKTTIAVLPFNDVSPGKDNEYFSDGLTEEIITDLGKIHSLRIVSRTSVMRLKGTEKDSPTIGRELGAQYLLEGSVRRYEDDLRITTQLIDAPSDSSLWAEKYSGKLHDVFAIQEQVSRSIVEALRLKLSPEEEEELEARLIDDFSAYDCYLRARKGIMDFTRQGLENALDELNRAIEIIGENELLIGGKGYVYWCMINLGILDRDIYLPQVEACAEKVFQLNPGAARCHLLLGNAKITKGKMLEALFHLKMATETDPNDPDALFWYSITAATAGKTTIAMEAANQLIAVDPLTPINQGGPGYALLNEGRFGLALPYVKKWYDLEPDSPHSSFWYGWLLAQNGRRDESCTILSQAGTTRPENLWARIGLCLKHALKGEKEALAPRVEKVAKAAARDMQYPWFLAECYALVGESTLALDWLDVATEQGFTNYPLVANLDPFLESIRHEPRFESILKKIKLEWEYFEF
jgi:non-specific serine/threonine protein kinase